jgi:hypothetical protein
MKEIYKYLIAMAVGAILTAFVTYTLEGNLKRDNDLISEKVRTVIKVVTKIDSVPYAVIDTVKVKGETVIINVPVENPMGTEPVYREVETTKYTGREELSNGTIDYEIYTDSLRATAFKLTTKDSIITNTIERTERLPPISRLYASGGLESSISGFSPQAASIGLMYNRRQKWGVGVEIRHDFSGLLPVSNQNTVGVKVLIGL